MKKPMKVSTIPPILKKTFFFIKEKAMPCMNLPKLKIIPEIYNNVTDASLNSSANIKIKNSLFRMYFLKSSFVFLKIELRKLKKKKKNLKK